MPVKLKLTFLSIIVILFTSRVQAQQNNSFINDINYPYLEKLIATAKKNYPEVKARQSQVNAAKGLYNSTVFSWLDGLTASYIYSPQTSINISQPTIFKGYQIAISLNIGQLFSRPGAIRQAKETYKVAEYQQAEYMLSLEAQVKRFYFGYLEAQADLRMRSNAVIDAESAVKQLKYAFQKGETTFQIYNEQLNSLYNQNSFKVQAELATFTAKTNLEELLGTKLEDVK